jgi:hypothetical protein
VTRVVLAPFKVASSANAGGHFWVYAQYADALQRLGCEVWWLEELPADAPAEVAQSQVATLLDRLRPFGLEERAILYRLPGDGPGAGQDPAYLTMPAERAERLFRNCELLVNFHYEMVPGMLARFTRTALVDIDPGLLQLWWGGGQLQVHRHDVYFSIGEKLGAVPGQPGVEWLHTRPAVSLDLWPYRYDPECSRVTSISSWRTRSYVLVDGSWLDSNKRAAYLDFVDVPRRVARPMEIATWLGEGEERDRALLEEHGWVVRDVGAVAGDPGAYQAYIQGSRAEFGCAKPAYVILGNAWVSDRTACYLASGKPAVVQYTGPSDYLPDGLGLLRFSTPEEATAGLAEMDAHYERHCRAAREIAEQCFSAQDVVTRLLHRALAR